MKGTSSVVTRIAFSMLFSLTGVILWVLGQAVSVLADVGRNVYAARSFSFVLIDPAVLDVLAGIAIMCAVISGVMVVSGLKRRAP